VMARPNIRFMRRILDPEAPTDRRWPSTAGRAERVSA
jgi:hypothetical protein